MSVGTKLAPRAAGDLGISFLYHPLLRSFSISAHDPAGTETEEASTSSRLLCWETEIVFNIIMRSVPWNTGHETMPEDRLFEYTDDPVIEQFRVNGIPAFDRLQRLPCLFMPEGIHDEACFVGWVTRVRIVNREIIFEYTIDQEIPPLQNKTIYANRRSLHMPLDFEFSRNHWGVKDVDLYRFLLRHARPRRQLPTVFRIAQHETIETTLMSAMMPFDAGLTPVFEAIRLAGANMAMRCRRADDIWENAAIIQDVVSLIDRSRIVVCDCTGRNPNVFYEAGIAHTLGRDVILITQSEHDIPFDLRHLRYIRYNNNGEGRALLTEQLQCRIRTLLGH